MFAAILFLVLPYAASYPDGAPQCALQPQHGSNIRSSGLDYNLRFSPPLNNGVADPNRRYTVRLNRRARGFALRVSDGQLSSASSSCPIRVECGDQFATQGSEDCQMRLSWTPPQSGQATFSYTAVKSKRQYDTGLSQTVFIGQGGTGGSGPFGTDAPVFPQVFQTFQTNPPNPNNNFGDSSSGGFSNSNSNSHEKRG